MSEEQSKHRLNSWKEVASFFGRTERTVMRWEAERGLPIHRLPGHSRSRIYAETDELKTWLSGQDDPDTQLPEAQPPAPPQAVAEKRGWRKWAVAGFATAMIIATVGISYFDGAQETPPPAAQVLYLKGMRDWTTRTPASLLRAVDEFNQAISVAPHYAEPYAGLAITYDLLREYTAMPSSLAYERARDNALKAIRLDERVANAHAALAFALFYGYGEADAAAREYARALVLEPNSAHIQHWYATFLLSRTELAGALDHINCAHRLDPKSRSIQADRAIIMAYAGQVDAAIGILRQLTVTQPDFRSPRAYLSQIYFSLKPDDEGYIRESLKSAQMAGDLYGESLVRAAQAGLKSSGHKGMLHALLTAQLDQLGKGVGSAMRIAEIYAKLGDDANAIVYLKMAADRKEEETGAYRLWPEYGRLKADPVFQAQIQHAPRDI